MMTVNPESINWNAIGGTMESVTVRIGPLEVKADSINWNVAGDEVSDEVSDDSINWNALSELVSHLSGLDISIKRK